MDLNTFIESIRKVDADHVNVNHFFHALMDSIDADDALPAADILTYLQCTRDVSSGVEKRILDIGVDVVQWLLEPTPQNRHIAFVAVDAWLKGLPNPWETI